MGDDAGAGCDDNLVVRKGEAEPERFSPSVGQWQPETTEEVADLAEKGARPPSGSPEPLSCDSGMGGSHSNSLAHFQENESMA